MLYLANRLTKEAIEADLAEHEKRKVRLSLLLISRDLERVRSEQAQYQETHHLPPQFDASKTSTDAKVESMLPQANQPGIADHEKQFAQQ